MKEVLEFLIPLISGLSIKYPIIVSAFAIMGLLRTIFKPLMTFISAYVLATESKKDDAKLEKLVGSKIYKAIVWLVDFFSSYKMKK